MGIFRNGELTTEQIGMLMAGVPIEELPKQSSSQSGEAGQSSEAAANKGKEAGADE